MWLCWGGGCGVEKVTEISLINLDISYIPHNIVHLISRCHFRKWEILLKRIG